MKREIKFRGWDQQAKYWNDKFSTKVGGEHNPLTEMYDWEGLQEYSMDVLVESQFEIMQLTGLKDSNGVDIYEGDILEWKSWKKENGINMLYRNVVEYFSGGQMCGFRIRNKSYHTSLTGNRIFNSNAIIVGNIYQNPELLTNK